MAFGINSSGQIVGTYFDSKRGKIRGFFDDGGVVRAIDVPFPKVSYLLCLCGINNSKDIVGEYVGTNGEGHAFLDHENTGVFKIVDFPGAIASGASGINNGGQIVGDYRDSARRLHGFLRTAGQYRTIDVPGFHTTAGGINSIGWIVGGFYDRTGKEHGFLYRAGHYQTIDVPGAPSTELEGINNQGQIVGVYRNSTGAMRGVLYSEGILRAIKVPFPVASDTEAYGINDLGQIVGVYSDGKGDHGFIATPAGHGVPTSGTQR
jgi:uncharacterized membrane protein